MKIILFAVFCTFFSYSYSYNYGDVFWRPFDGTIPIDAYILEENDDPLGPLYLGQIWTPSGSDVGVIRNGETSIVTYWKPGVYYDYNLQILCSRNSNALYWNTTSSTTFGSDTLGLNAVISGTYGTNDPVYVGRALYSGSYLYGHIHYNGNLHVPYGSSTKAFSSYEVLIETRTK